MSKKMFSNFIISAICYIALGITLMVWPETSLNIFCYVIGGVTAAYGLWRIYRYVTHRTERYATVGLFVGIIALALGICLFVKPEIFSSILPIILGLYLVFDGIIKLQAVLEIKKDGYKKWGILLLLALLMVVLGVVIVFNPFDSGVVLTAFVGASMLVDGVINLWNAIVVRQQLNLLRDVVDAVDTATPAPDAAAPAPEEATAAQAEAEAPAESESTGDGSST